MNDEKHLGPRVLISCSIHFGYKKRLNATEVVCKFIERWF